jgi:outer membrane protein assembly factor BamC
MKQSSHSPTRSLALPTGARWTGLALVAALTSGCSVLQEDRIDYTSAKQVNTLEIPPDLSQISRDPRFAMPASVVTASGMQSAQPQGPATAIAAVQKGDVRIERAGSQRWLVVDRPPEALWSAIRDFWQESGFVLTLSEQNLGLLETDWAENRAKLPQDFIRATIGRVFDSLYSTGERDKFRTRLERSASGGTEIYLSHRGMVEVYTSARQDATMWQPRPADPELEAEFLRRLMVKLGVDQAQSQALLTAGGTQPAARVVTQNQQVVVELDEGFDRAWRRVGLALDRTGFTVEDRDRSQGLYFVRYVATESAEPAARSGFFSRLWSGSRRADAEPVRYRIAVKGTDTLTTVSVLNASGQAESSASAQRIAQLIADDLK